MLVIGNPNTRNLFVFVYPVEKKKAHVCDAEYKILHKVP